jgi:hypothetical protein
LDQDEVEVEVENEKEDAAIGQEKRDVVMG